MEPLWVFYLNEDTNTCAGEPIPQPKRPHLFDSICDALRRNRARFRSRREITAQFNSRCEMP